MIMFDNEEVSAGNETCGLSDCVTPCGKDLESVIVNTAITKPALQ